MAATGIALAQGGSMLGVEFGGRGKPADVPTWYAGPVRKGFERPTAPKNGPPAFLTEAIDWDIENYSKFDASVFYPTKLRTEKPFYDLPFAVNIPFEVPFADGTVHAFFDVNIVWDEPERKLRIGDREPFSEANSRWDVGNQGIYRMDGSPVPAENVIWEIDSKSFDRLVTPADAPFPFLLTGGLPTPQNRYSPTTSLDVNCDLVSAKVRPPFRRAQNANTLFALSRPVTLRSPSPGWHALWFTLSPRVSLWPPAKLRPDDTLRATIYVHYMVGRRERFQGWGDYFTGADLEYLWDGRDVKPTRPIDPKLLRVHTVAIPLVLRRDGWVLTRVDVRRDENDGYQDVDLPPRDSSKTTGWVIRGKVTPHANGATAKYELHEHVRATDTDPWPQQPKTSTALTWDFAFPAEIPDGGVGEILAKGGVQEKGFNRDYWQRATRGELDSSLPRWLGRPLSVSRDLDPHEGSRTISLVEPSDKANYTRYWGDKLGDRDASRHFANVRNNLPPKTEAEAKRYWIYAEPIDPHSGIAQNARVRQLLYKDLGPHYIVQCDIGPWTLYGCYRRKCHAEKIVSGSPTAGSVTPLDEKDPFWTKWYPAFSRELRRLNFEIAAFEREMALYREPLDAAKRRSRQLLMGYQQGMAGHGGFVDWFFGSGGARAEVSEASLARMINSAREHNRMAEEYRVLMRRLSDKIRAHYGEILRQLGEARQQYADRHAERLTYWQRHYRQLREAADLKLAIATSDLGALQQAFERAQLEAEMPETWLMLAQVQLENGQPVSALEALRQAKRQHPDHPEIQSRIRELECAFLKVAMDRSQGTIGQARQQFYTYLGERGMGGEKHGWVGGKHNPLSALDTELAWAVFTTGITGSVSALLGRPEEESRALGAVEHDLTIAYVGAQAILRLRMRGHEFNEIKAMPTARLAEALNEGAPNAPPIDRQGALNLGLAIQRAFQLPELKALAAEDQAAADSSNAAAVRLGSDLSALRAGVKAQYWDLSSVGNTWAEWVGDLSSPKNLVTFFLPMSIGRVGGKVQGVTYWTRAEAGLIQAAVREGYVDTGTMVVAKMIGWDRALKAAGGTRAGEFMLRQLERSQKYQESLGLIGQTGWTLGKAVSVMALQGLMVHQAEAIGGPKAALAVEMMLLFGADTDVLFKFLDAGRVARAPLITAIDRHFVPQAQRQVKLLKSVGEEIPLLAAELDDMARGVSASPRRDAAGARSSPVPGDDGRGLPELPAGRAEPPAADGSAPSVGSSPAGRQRQAGIDTPPVGNRPPARPGTPRVQPAGRGVGSSKGMDSGAETDPNLFSDVLGPAVDSRRSVPNGMPANDASISNAAAHEGKELGTNNGAIVASQSLARDLQQEIVVLEKRVHEAQQLSQKLKSVPVDGPISTRAQGTMRGAPKEYGNYIMPARPTPGSTWARAMQAKHAENFEEAERLFLKLKQEYAEAARAGRKLGPHDLPLDLIEDEIAQVRHLLTTPKAVPNPAAIAQITKAIPDDEVDRILALPRKVISPSGVSGTIEATVGAPYMVKHVEIGGGVTPDTANMIFVAEGEMVMAEIKRALGLPVPGVQAKFKWASTGQDTSLEAMEFIYRRVPGPTADKLSPAELYHLREGISEHHGIDIVFGDFDGKMDNMMVAAGTPLRIDSGYADPRGARARHYRRERTDPETIAGHLGSDHWYARAYERRLQYPEHYQIILQTWRANVALTYKAAKRGVDRLKTLLDDPVRRAELKKNIRDVYYRIHRDNPHYRGYSAAEMETIMNGLAEQVLQNGIERMPGVESALRNLNLRNGLPFEANNAAWPRRRPSNLVPFEPVVVLSPVLLAA